MALHNLSAPLMRRAALVSGISALALLMTAPAFAADSGDVAEVVVTANKLNAQKVLDVPGAIQALSGDAMQAAGVSAFMDIANEIPGLAVEDLGPGDKRYVIRGVNSAGDSTTGIYYGEAVISGSNSGDGGGFNPDIRLYDMDHVEVLRGPQGTLYGASSMSGAIRFIPKAPDLNTFGGYINAEASDTQHGSDNLDANGALNLPIVDGKMALRVVGWKNDDSGFINQIRVGGDGGQGLVKGVNNDNVNGGRATLRVQPMDDLTIDASITDQNETSNGSSRYTPAGVTSWGTPPGTPAPYSQSITPVQGCDLCNTDVTLSPWADDLQVYSLNATYKLPTGTLTATTNQFNRKVNFNFNSTPVLIANGVNVEAITEEPMRWATNNSEIRYASDYDFPVNFVVGGYRQYETSRRTVSVVSSNSLGQPNASFNAADSADPIFTGTPNLLNGGNLGTGDTFFGRWDDRQTTEYAGFGEATWKVTPDLTVIGGVRYFTETLNGQQDEIRPFTSDPVGEVIDPTQQYSHVSFKGNASYKFDDALMAYATFSQGFRGGGLNAQSDPFQLIPSTFRPDTLDNYEVGAKGRLFGGKLDYMADAYLINWNNMQVEQTTSNGQFTYTGNVGQAQIKGVEFELTAHPIEHLSANLSGSYQSAMVTQGADAYQKSQNSTLSLTGEDVPGVPKWQLDLGLTYTKPINDDWAFTAGGDVSYRGAEDAYSPSSPFNIRLQSYTLVNLRAGFLEGLWSVTAFARNVTNERAQVSAINSQQDPDAMLTVRPRTVGLNLNRTF